MAKTRRIRGSPAMEGNLEISKERRGIFIGGDPEGLRSLGRLLIWLADVDQELVPGMPDGERYHVRLWAKDPARIGSLTPFSQDTEVCRLDAKGMGRFPTRYRGIPRKKK